MNSSPGKNDESDLKDLFKDIKFFISGDINDKVIDLLKRGGAERLNYFSDFVTHLIVGNNPEENDIVDANDVYEVPALTPKWVLMCASLKRLVGIKSYLYVSGGKLFTNLVFCFSNIKEDLIYLWSLITFNGGVVQLNLNKYCNFLITTGTHGIKYDKANSLGSEYIKIVTPDWVVETVKHHSFADTNLFHPKLINWPKPAKHESTTAITGFEPEQIESTEQNDEKAVSDSTQALLDKLKQRMPWNQPNTPQITSSSDRQIPPNVVAPSFISKTHQQVTQAPRSQTTTVSAHSPVTSSLTQISKSPTTSMSTQPVPRSIVHHTSNQQQNFQPQPTQQSHALNISRLIGQPQARPNIQLRGPLAQNQLHQQLIQQRIHQNQQIIQRASLGQIQPQQILQQQLAQGQVNQRQLIQNQLNSGQVLQQQVNQNPLIGQNQQGQLNQLQQQHIIKQNHTPIQSQQMLTNQTLQQQQQNQLSQQQNQLQNQLSQQQGQLNQQQSQQQNQLSQPQNQANQQQINQQAVQQQIHLNQEQTFVQPNINQHIISQQNQQIIQKQSFLNQQVVTSTQVIQNQPNSAIQQQQFVSQELNQQTFSLNHQNITPQSNVNQQLSQQLNNQNLVQPQISQQNQILQPIGQQKHLSQLHQDPISQQISQLSHQLSQQNQLNQQNQLAQQINQQNQIIQQNQLSQQQNSQNQINQQSLSQNQLNHQQNNPNQQISQQNHLTQQLQTQLTQQISQSQLSTQQNSQQQKINQLQINHLNRQQINQQLDQHSQMNQQLNQQTLEGLGQQALTQQSLQYNRQNLQLLNQQVVQQQNINQQALQQGLAPQAVPVASQQNIQQGLTQQNLQAGLNQQTLNQQQSQNQNLQQVLDQNLQQQGLNQHTLQQHNLNQQSIQQQQINQINQVNSGLQPQQVVRTQFQSQQSNLGQQILINQTSPQNQSQRAQINQHLWTQQPTQIGSQQIIRHPVNIVQQGAPRMQWSPNQANAVPQRQFIQLDAKTHNELQKMPPEQQALFVARLQRQRQLIKQVQQRGGGGSHILIRGNVPPGLTTQQQVQWLQQQAKQQGIVLPSNIQQQNITPGTLTQQGSAQSIQHAPGLSPINQNSTQFSDQNQQQQLQLRQYRLQQLQLQREQAQKNHLAQQQGAIQQPTVVRPIGQPQLADSTTNPPHVADNNIQHSLVVNAKTKTALANMLSIKLQSGGSSIGVQRPDTIQEPSAAGTLRLMTAQHNAALNSKPQEIISLQRRTISGPNGEIIKPPGAQPLPVTSTSEPPKLQYCPKPTLPLQHRPGPFYGHNPNLKLPPDLFLLGCIFVVVEIETFLEEQVPGWQQSIEKHGGEVEKQYCNRVTHVLCETQRHGVVMQALRDCKRCVTVVWLNDIMHRKQVLPPWTALHLPNIYLDTAPASKHLISITGFEGNDRSRVKQMIKYIGAKCTTYFSKHNTLLISAKQEGKKCTYAKKWQIPIVNIQWLTDVMLGHFAAINQMDHQIYQQYPSAPNFSFDPKLVPNLMVAWKAPINISQESYERVKRSASPVVLPKKPKKLKVEPTDENDNMSDEQIMSATHCILFSMYSNTKELNKMVRDLGGVVAKDHHDFTHLVMPNLARSNKLFFAIAKDAHVISEQWLKDSHQANQFLDESTYNLSSKHFNFEYKCDIEQTFLTRNRNRLFDGKFFFVTPSVFPSKRIVVELIQSCGGTVERIRRSLAQIEATSINSPYSYFIVTHENDLHLVADLLKNKKDKMKIVCNVELIFSAVLNQTFEVEPYAVCVL